MVPTIYISVPVTVDWAEVNKVVRKIHSVAGTTVNVRYWDRGTSYSQSLVRDCDIFILMTPDNTWEMKREALPSGVYRELTLATHHNKPVFMVYKNAELNYNFYSYNIIGGKIKGIPGSSTEIWKDIEELVKTTSLSSPDSYQNSIFPKDFSNLPKGIEVKTHFDRRLLL
jgi:hypothetical protein